MSIFVESLVDVYEVDDVATLPRDRPVLRVSDSDTRGAVVVTTPDGKSYTVYAADLKAAIDNATNTGAA